MKYQRTMILVAILAVSIGVGWNYATQDAGLPRDVNCTVQFRRDALGMGGNSPTSPLTGNHNGADVSVTGKVVHETPEWLVLATTTQELWIPKHSVLLVSRELKK